MAFDNDEDSIEDGRPLRLYRFSLNDKTWRYTSADADVTKGGYTWLATPISDEGVSQTGESTTDALTISATTDIVPAQLYMAYPPARPVQVAIFDAHEDSNDIRAVYAGEITGMNITSPGSATFTAETIAASMSREGLRLGWQRACPYALYDPVTCKVNKATFAVAGTVASVTDNEVQVASLATALPNLFSGGFLEWTDPVRGLERRPIEYHSATLLIMFGTADGITPGLVVTVYPGCDRTTGVNGCQRFGNLDNYGGAPGMQGVSPFDGTPVFN